MSKEYTNISIEYDSGRHVDVRYEGNWQEALLNLPRIVEEAKGLEGRVNLPLVRSSGPLVKKD